MSDKNEEKALLPHHEQLPLCTSRLPYRQGRKLTAVKTYTITNESNHLLIFGVPSLNLRQEAKSLCLHFGKLLQFYVSNNHPAEPFTETYHARYEKIQSARVAKRMIDTRNFYGGSLHVSYAPELESIEETRAKLMQRRKDVQYRLRNLQKEIESKEKIAGPEHSISLQNNSIDLQENSIVLPENINEIVNEVTSNKDALPMKMNMGENNIIYLNKKRKMKHNEKSKHFSEGTSKKEKSTIEIVDCTNTDKEIISNINEALNYNNFGNEIIRKVENKPLNRIVFAGNKKS